MYLVGQGLEHVADFRPEKKADYIAGLTTMAEMFPYMPPAQLSWQHADQLTAYANGVTAIHNTGSYFFGELISMAPGVMTPEKTVNLPWPTKPGMDPQTSTYSVGYVMFKDSRNKQAAAEVLKYFTTKVAVNEWPMNMAPKKGLSLDDRIKANKAGEQLRWYLGQWEDLLKQTKATTIWPYVPTDEVNKIWTDEVIRLYKKEITPEQAYDNLKAGIEPKLISQKR